MKALLVLLLVCIPVLAADKQIVSSEITLREYVDIRFDQQEKAVTSALAAADRAVAKAEAAADKRFESVNEFRQSLNDQSRMQMPRTEAEQQFARLNEKIDISAKRMDAIEQQNKGKNDGWLLLVAAVALLSSIISVYFAVVNRKPSVKPV